MIDIACIKLQTKLLFVCLGNICRSPAAEAVFLKLAKEKKIEDSFLVDSAGTGHWHVGKLADSRMIATAKKRGFAINSIARQIQKSDFNKFDYIITMDNDNFEVVREMSKNINAGTNIIPLLTYHTKSNLKEVPDPYYGGPDGFENVLDLLEEACINLINELT